MKIVLFYHSVISDWNHGNAHFLRGIATELYRLGHEVRILEPANGWSLSHLVEERGEAAFDDFERNFPRLTPNFYHLENPNLDPYLRDADLVIVHEWNDPFLIELVGRKKCEFGYKLLFHDTHHRAKSEPDAMNRNRLAAYDGVLAFGDPIRDLYLKNGWVDKAWTWYEAADDAHFYPRRPPYKEGDLVWVGNWGADRCADFFEEILIKPVRDLKISATLYGSGFPDPLLEKIRRAGIRFKGYLPSTAIPEVYSKYHCTIHIPRSPYCDELPGIPTIKTFEAMACGIPLLSAPWRDAHMLFKPGEDFLISHNAREMTRNLNQVIKSETLRSYLSRNGLRTVQEKHLCSHRVEQLFGILRQIETVNQSRLHS